MLSNRTAMSASAFFLTSALSFVRPRRRAFFRPDRRFPTPTRTEAVKAGRRSAIEAHSDVSRPRLDSLEHGGRLDEHGPRRIVNNSGTCVTPVVWSAVSKVQRRCPWARATIASPYIRQLRYGLPLCCMHGRSREKDGAHLHNGRLARPNLRWFSPATHPTRPTLH